MTRAGKIRASVPFALLAIPVAIGAFLRFRGLGRPSLWLDEILGWDLTTAALRRPLWHWFAGLEPEHGPLFYATQLLRRFAQDPELAVRVMPALFGTVTIVLVWMASRYAGGEVAAFCAAMLLATSPLHVYYSREGRPYALVTMLAAAMLVALLRQSRALPLIVLAAVYSSATAAPLAIAGTIGAFLSAALTPVETIRRRMVRSGALSMVAVCLVPLLYRGERRPSAPGAGFPSLDWEFFDSLYRAFAVTATDSDARGRTAAALVVLVLAGAFAVTRVSRRRGAVVTTMTVLPALIAIVVLWGSGHWFAIRYLSPALPGYVVLAAAGIAGIARLVASGLRVRPRVVATVLALIIVTSIAAQTVPQAMTEPFRKLDWRLVASTIAGHARDGDLVVAAEPWSAVSLRHYLPAGRLRLHEVTRPEIAAALVHERGRVWFVTAGYSANPAVRDWICRFPVVLASELEGFRLHYAPDIHDLLRERSTRFERAAIAAAYGPGALTLEMGEDDAALLGRGWSSPEGEPGRFVRWAVDGRSEVLLPLAGRTVRTIAVRVLPLEHRGLSSQVVRILLNGHELADITLQPDWNELLIEAPAAVWREDANNVLTFQFARVHAPSDLDPKATDDRRLTALFDWITVSPVPPALLPAARHPARIVRLQETAGPRLAPYLDQETAWQAQPTRLPAHSLDRQRVEPLLGRLGFDPAVAWPRIASGEVRLEDLVTAAPLYMPCADDGTLVQLVWRLLFERGPNMEEQRVLLSILRSSRSRKQFMEKIVRMDEFRHVIQSP